MKFYLVHFCKSIDAPKWHKNMMYFFLPDVVKDGTLVEDLKVGAVDAWKQVMETVHLAEELIKDTVHHVHTKEEIQLFKEKGFLKGGDHLNRGKIS